MKKHLMFLVISFLTFQVGHSQTPVSGGVFSNTTWTQANSPYLVTGNAVVFPGVILTIQPGVTIKFYDGIKMEIRQSTLIANGTASDPIVFTSNNLNPSRGIWDQIYVNQSVSIQIKHCEFHYANTALTGQGNSLSVVSSTFTENITGMDAQSNYYVRIDSCIFRNNNTGQSLQPGYYMSINNCIYIKNETGLYAQSGCSVFNCILDSNSVYGLLKHMACNDTVRDNEIKYNGTGISHDFSGCGGTVFIHHNVIENNNVGILLQNTGGSQQFNIYSNSLCSNFTYNIQNLTTLNVNAANNCWCSNSLSYIQTTIYDGYDNVNYGIVTYIPIDTVICPMILPTGILDNTLKLYNIYPNPFSQYAKLEFENLKNENNNLLIYNSFGQLVRSIDNIITGQVQIERGELTIGLYLFQLRTDKEIITSGKFIIE